MAFVSMLTRYCGQADCSRLLKIGARSPRPNLRPHREWISSETARATEPPTALPSTPIAKPRTPAAMAPESAFELTGRYLACTLEVIDAITAEAILN